MIVELAIAIAIAALQPIDSAATTRELEAFEQQLAEAWKAGDCAGWGARLAPEWSVIHITGHIISRAEALELCKSPHSPIDSQKVDEIVVRPYGDSAVVTGRTTVVTGGASPVTVSLRFTDVFERRDGRWLVVASHATRLGS